MFNCCLKFQWFVVPTVLIHSRGGPSKKKKINKYGGKYPTTVDKINQTRRAGTRRASKWSSQSHKFLLYSCNQLFFLLLLFLVQPCDSVFRMKHLWYYNEIIYLFWNFCANWRVTLCGTAEVTCFIANASPFILYVLRYIIYNT